jgi:hypothetical protein
MKTNEIIAKYQADLDACETPEARAALWQGLETRWLDNRRRLVEWAISMRADAKHPFDWKIDAWDCDRILLFLGSSRR